MTKQNQILDLMIADYQRNSDAMAELFPQTKELMAATTATAKINLESRQRQLQSYMDIAPIQEEQIKRADTISRMPHGDAIPLPAAPTLRPFQEAVAPPERVAAAPPPVGRAAAPPPVGRPAALPAGAPAPAAPAGTPDANDPLGIRALMAQR